MRLLIHDLTKEQFDLQFPEMIKEMKTSAADMEIIADDETINKCMGCFGCWVKTPGVCVIKDKYQNMGELLSKSEEVIIISKGFYGGFSPFVKNVMDRSISYVLPYFETRNGEMHHKSRYEHQLVMKVWLYGENITEEENQTSKALIKANAINLACKFSEVKIVGDFKEITLS